MAPDDVEDRDLVHLGRAGAGQTLGGAFELASVDSDSPAPCDLVFCFLVAKD